MTPKALQRFALSLPDAHEEPHFDRISFRIGKKIFATMTPSGDEAMVRVDPAGVEAFLASQPEVFFSYGGWTVKNGSLGVRLAKVDATLMKDLVTDSWRHSAPRRTVAAFDGKTTKKLV